MNERETYIVTGGAGFIGGNLAHFLVRNGCRVVTLDKLTYAGNIASLEDLPALTPGGGHLFVRGDIADADLVERLLNEHRPDGVFNLAAESHVDRSIDGPAAFIETNVVGTFRLLEATRNYLAAPGGEARQARPRIIGKGQLAPRRAVCRHGEEVGLDPLLRHPGP